VDVRGRIPDALPSPADTVLARISAEWVVMLGAPDAEGRLFRAIEPLAGPDLVGVLERTTSWDPSTLAAGEATGAPIVEVRALVVRRDLPVPVLELYVATEYARYVWEALWGVVASLGGAPVGWQALRAEGWR
jgi:hypothetical protein